MMGWFAAGGAASAIVAAAIAMAKINVSFKNDIVCLLGSFMRLYAPMDTNIVSHRSSGIYDREASNIWGHARPCLQPELLLPRDRLRTALMFTSWPPPWFCFAPHPGHLFNPGIEAFVAQRLILIQRKADIVNRRHIEMRAEQVPIGGLPPFVATAQRQKERMRREPVIGLSQCIGAIAGPAVMRRIVHHGGSDGIELDVALTSQQIGFGLHQRGLIAAIPQRAGAPVAAVDVLHIAPAEGNDQLRHRLRLFRREQQVHLDGPEHIAEQGALVFAQGILQPIQISSLSFFSNETRMAIMAARPSM